MNIFGMGLNSNLIKKCINGDVPVFEKIQEKSKEAQEPNNKFVLSAFDIEIDLFNCQDNDENEEV